MCMYWQLQWLSTIAHASTLNTGCQLLNPLISLLKISTRACRVKLKVSENQSQDCTLKFDQKPPHCIQWCYTVLNSLVQLSSLTGLSAHRICVQWNSRQCLHDKISYEYSVYACIKSMYPFPHVCTWKVQRFPISMCRILWESASNSIG